MCEFLFDIDLQRLHLKKHLQLCPHMISKKRKSQNHHGWSTYPPKLVSPLKNKGSIVGLMKGNLWFSQTLIKRP